MWILTAERCCSRLLQQAANRSVICRRWVLPLRVAVLLGLFASALFMGCHMARPGSLSLTTTFLAALQVILSLSILAECRRSVSYHNDLKASVRRPGPE